MLQTSDDNYFLLATINLNAFIYRYIQYYKDNIYKIDIIIYRYLKLTLFFFLITLPVKQQKY